MIEIRRDRFVWFVLSSVSKSHQFLFLQPLLCYEVCFNNVARNTLESVELVFYLDQLACLLTNLAAYQPELKTFR